VYEELKQCILLEVKILPDQQPSAARPYEKDSDVDLEFEVSKQAISKAEYRYNYAGDGYELTSPTWMKCY